MRSFGELSVVFFFMAFLFVLPIEAQAEWKQEMPLSNLSDIWGSSADNIYAVGDQGLILHYDGSDWTRMESETNINFEAVWGSSEEDVYAVGNKGTILHFTGTTWTRINSGTDEGLTGIWGSSENNVFVVGDNGTVLHFDGSSWTHMDTKTTINFKSVWGSSDHDVFTVGFEQDESYEPVHAAILHYDGFSWTVVHSAETGVTFTDVWGSSGESVFVVGRESSEGGANWKGLILYYDGLSWNQMDSGTERNLTSVWGSSASDVFAVGDFDTVLHYDGNAWTPMDSKTTSLFLTGVWGYSDDSVFAVGWDASILHYDGAQWTRVTDDSKDRYDSFWKLWGASCNDVFAVGYYHKNYNLGEIESGGIIYHYDGKSWSQMDIKINEPLYDIWGSSSEDVFVVGNSSTILHYDGRIWTWMNVSPSINITKIWGYSPQDVFALGRIFEEDAGYLNSVVLHYDGTSWTQTDLDVATHFNDVWSSSAEDIYISGDDGHIFHYDGTSWAQMDIGIEQSIISILSIWGSSATDVYAIAEIYSPDSQYLYSHELLRYDGTSWVEVDIGIDAGLIDIWGSSPTNIFVAGTKQGAIILHYDGTDWSWDQVQGVSAIWGSPAGDVFAIGKFGSLQYYNNGIWMGIRANGGDLRDIWGCSEGDIFVVGDRTILHYEKSAYVTQNLADADLTPPDPTDAATVMELPAGAYTVHLAPKDDPGNGMMDVYDLETQSTTAVLQGISSRAYVQAGDNILIAGFAIEGTGTKKVAIRGIGQGLRTQGVATDLDAGLEVYDATRRMIASNGDWDAALLAPPLNEAKLTPPDPTDAALILDLPAGQYTVQLKPEGTAGIGLVDVYDLDPQAGTTVLKGIGSRAYVQADDDILISGFMIRGTGTKKVAIRGIGQGLASQDVPTDLDAVIRVLDATPQVIMSNDNWQYSPFNPQSLSVESFE